MGYSACKEGESGGKIGSAIVDGSFGYTRVYPVDSTILFSWMIRDLLNTSFLFLNDSYQRAYLWRGILCAREAFSSVFYVRF